MQIYRRWIKRQATQRGGRETETEIEAGAWMGIKDNRRAGERGEESRKGKRGISSDWERENKEVESKRGYRNSSRIKNPFGSDSNRRCTQEEHSRDKRQQ